mgnify:CR=1 FL=1
MPGRLGRRIELKRSNMYSFAVSPVELWRHGDLKNGMWLVLQFHLFLTADTWSFMSIFLNYFEEVVGVVLASSDVRVIVWLYLARDSCVRLSKPVCAWKYSAGRVLASLVCLCSFLMKYHAVLLGIFNFIFVNCILGGGNCIITFMGGKDCFLFKYNWLWESVNQRELLWAVSSIDALVVCISVNMIGSMKLGVSVSVICDVTHYMMCVIWIICKRVHCNQHRWQWKDLAGSFCGTDGLRSMRMLLQWGVLSGCTVCHA